MEFADIVLLWESEVTAKSEEMAAIADVDALNAAIDEIIAINNNYTTQFQNMIDNFNGIDCEDLQSDIDETVGLIQDTIDEIEELNEIMESLKQ